MRSFVYALQPKAFWLLEGFGEVLSFVRLAKTLTLGVQVSLWTLGSHSYTIWPCLFMMMNSGSAEQYNTLPKTSTEIWDRHLALDSLPMDNQVPSQASGTDFWPDIHNAFRSCFHIEVQVQRKNVRFGALRHPLDNAWLMLCMFRGCQVSELIHSGWSMLWNRIYDVVGDWNWRCM